jgi:hypothetical protein
LARGVEARSFARRYGQLLLDVQDHLAKLQETERLVPAEDAVTARVREDLHALVREMEAYRELLAEAVARASATPPPFDESTLPPGPTGPKAEGYISVKEAIERVRARKKP